MKIYSKNMFGYLNFREFLDFVRFIMEREVFAENVIL